MSTQPTFLPRYRRASAALPPFRPQERDQRIMAIIEDYGLIRSDHLKHLAPGSPQNNLRRLQKLFHHGLVNRMQRDRLPFNSPIVYTHKDPRTISDLYLKHTLAISHFRFVLEMTVQHTPGAELIMWQPDGAVKEHVSYSVNGRPREKTIEPDAVFGIALNGSVWGGFLELDRGTIAGTKTPSGRLWRRYEAMWHYWYSEKYKESFGFSSLRIFTVTKSEQRKANFRRLVSKAGQQKRGSNLFWFTEMPSYETDPLAMARPIWQTTKDDALRIMLPV